MAFELSNTVATELGITTMFLLIVTLLVALLAFSATL
jgi:hypothetical protein